jgi:hypothetical protein
MSPSNHRAAIVMAALVVLMATRAFGQGLSVTVSAGRVVYAPLASSIDTSNVLGTLRYDAPNAAWVYGTGAAPFRSSDPKWVATGAGARVLPSGAAGRRVTLGADLDAHGFWHHDSLAVVTDNGVIAEAVPFLRFSRGLANLDVRGGWRGSALSHAGLSSNRGVFETGVRAGYGALLRVEGDARWVRAREGTYPFVGGTVIYASSAVQAWAQIGKWTNSVLTDVAAGGGIGVSLGNQMSIWGVVLKEAPDPLYWNIARRSVSVGITRRLGAGARQTTSSSPAIRQSEPGGVAIRVHVADAPGARLSVGGDFNNWQAVPMEREGSEWVLRLPLARGVYHYAFKKHDGEWFVPASVAGRRPDGMGGYNAVLVVN